MAQTLNCPAFGEEDEVEYVLRVRDQRVRSVRVLKRFEGRGVAGRYIEKEGSATSTVVIAELDGELLKVVERGRRLRVGKLSWSSSGLPPMLRIRRSTSPCSRAR
ncbi:MAG: hypothetical protein QXT79_07080 [Thermofilaceae archaeon]